jgi:hypothetical protein
MTTKTYVDPSDISAVIRNNSSASDKTKIAFSAVANVAGVTWTAAQALSGIIDRSGAATVSDTTPTAAQLVAAFSGGASVGDVVLLRVRNRNTGTLTVVAGTGVTLEGTTTVVTVNTRKYAVRFTNVTVGSEAVTLSGLFTGAN